MNPEPAPTAPPDARPSDTPSPSASAETTVEARLSGGPSAGPNGEPPPGTPRAPASSRLPRGRRRSRERKLLTAVAAGLLGVAVVLGVILWWTGGGLFGSASFTGPTWTVKRDKLKVTIVARGNLESAKNGDIICNVRSGTKGSTSATTIKWLIDNGMEVKKGDKVIELDD